MFLRTSLVESFYFIPFGTKQLKTASESRWRSCAKWTLDYLCHGRVHYYSTRRRARDLRRNAERAERAVGTHVDMLGVVTAIG